MAGHARLTKEFLCHRVTASHGSRRGAASATFSEQGAPELLRGKLFSKEEDPMKRVGFLLQVRPDKIDEYKKHHEAVWPEMLDALRRTGWHNYSLFLREDGLLFGYFETPESFQAALDGMAKEEINARWQDFMAPYFDGLGGVHADESMLELEEVFHLD
jgi:L-rhamnose mutarotase